MLEIQSLIKPISARHVLLNFSGWPDAGKMIESTLMELSKAFPFDLAATWDMDDFWHTEATRPKIVVQHGQIKKIEWPTYQFYLGKVPAGGQILMGTGPEPNCRWRTFAKTLVEKLQEWGCEEVLLLGSMYDQIFHDEVVISCVVQDHQAYNRMHDMGCQLIEYEGPSAVHSAIMEAAGSYGMRCIGFWAHLPFYLKGPNELLMMHLLKILGNLLEFEPDTFHLMEKWRERQEKIEALIRQDQELRQTLEFLRQQDRPQKSSSYSPSKVVRLDEFLKKRHEHDTEEEE